MEHIEIYNINWLTFLLVASALHGLWLAVLLFLKNKKALFLGIAFLIFSLYLVNYLLFLTGVIRSLPHLFGAFYPLLFLIGPCFYFFVKQSLEPGFQFVKIQLWHLLLPAVVFFDTLELYAMSAERKLKTIEFILTGQIEYTWFTVLVSSGFLIQLAAYVAAAWCLARQTEIKQANDINRQSAQWYKQFSLFFLILLLLDLGIRFVFFAMKWKAPELEMTIAALVALGIHLAGYKALGRLPDFPKIRPHLSKENGISKYKTSPLTPKQIEMYKINLLSFMKSEKPYLDAALKISDLATALGIPSHHLSQVLNEGMETNFYDFINTYRIEAVKLRLEDKNYSHYNILSIGLECGFANKTTFNRIFKKRTGMTPSKFLNDKNTALQ